MDAVTASTGAGAAARLDACRRLVVKVGSALLVDEAGALRQSWLEGLAEDLEAEQAAGRQVLIVSSGAIALGRAALGLAKGPLVLEEAQAAAAVGQTRLVRAWEDALAAHGLATGQILLTLDDTQDRRRYLSGRATLGVLLSRGLVPVVNENDTVATDEIRYGDNDRLAARVALMADAEILVLLSDVDGLYSADPRRNPDAEHLPEVPEITPEIEAMAGGTGTAVSSGGMRTKLLAAKTALQGGCAMAVTLGGVHRPLRALRLGGRATWFLSDATPAAARKRWIAGMKPLGTVTVDAGAARALRQGKSLLPAGVVSVEGAFRRGDPVAIVTADGEALGAALVAYSAAEARAIVGIRSGEIEGLLGYPGRAALAHRDNLVMWRT